MRAAKHPVMVSGAESGECFRAALDDAIAQAREDRLDVVVDLREVEVLGYLSAITLLRASYLIAAAGARMVVVAPDRATLAALQRVGIGTSLRVCSTLGEAREQINGAEL